MEIRYTLNRDDYKEFLQLAYARVYRIGKGKIKFFFLHLVGWFFIGMALNAVFRFNTQYGGLDFFHLHLAVVFLGTGTTWICGTAVYHRRFYTRYSLGDDGYLSKAQHARFTDEGIVLSGKDTKQTYLWSAVQATESAKNVVCLFIDNSQAIIFPKRAYRDKDQLDSFLELVDSKTKKR
jgi:hypothetical protein